MSPYIIKVSLFLVLFGFVCGDFEDSWSRSPISTRFDFKKGSTNYDEGSGSLDDNDDEFSRSLDNDDEDFYSRSSHLERGSGNSEEETFEDDEDFEGSGDENGADNGADDLFIPTNGQDWQSRTTPKISTTTTTLPTTTTSTTTTTATTTTTTIKTTTSTTTTTTTTLPTTTTIKTTTAKEFDFDDFSGSGDSDEDDEDFYEEETVPKNSNIPITTTTESTDIDFDDKTRPTRPPRITTPRPTKNNKNTGDFGPDKQPVETFLLENKIIIVSLYVTFVGLLLVTILVCFCTLHRCRTYHLIREENGSDSSDLSAQKRRNYDEEETKSCFGTSSNNHKNSLYQDNNASIYSSKRKSASQLPHNPNWL